MSHRSRSAWTPPMLGGCVQWLDAKCGVTLTGGKVSRWDDLSGGGNHATQATAGNRPTVVSAGLNGQATIAFSGTNFLSHSLRVQTPCTFAFVAKTTNNDALSYSCVGSWSGGAGGAFIFAKPDTPNEWGYYANGNALSGATLLNTFKRCVSVARASNDIDLRTGGVSVTATTGVSAYAAASAIGAGNGVGTQNLEGEIAEIVAFNRTLTVAECQRLEAYFAVQHGL